MSRSRIIYFCLCFIFLILIAWRYQIAESRIRNNELKQYNDLEEKVILIGTIIKEPDIREKSTKLTIKTTEVRPPLTSGGRTSTRILATTARYPEYKYGDELKITGKLQTPLIFEGFDYKDFLENKGIYSVIYYPQIEVFVRGRTSYKNFGMGVYAKILDFKDRLRQGIYGFLSPPQSEILGSMILGDKNRMSARLKEKLNIAGLRHITAVSGLHIVLLSGILMSLLIGLGFWRGQAFYISLIFIFLFIALTGFQVSSIRAGMMAGIFLLGQKIGRKSVSSRSIVISAGIMLIINPLLIWDIGFQLSFLAAGGIISLSSFFGRWLRFLPEEKFLNLRSILSMTFSAYLFTLPILIYNFGQISLVAPLTNVLVLPIVSLIMVFGFIFGLAGLIWPPLGWLLFFPCWFLLTYVAKVVDFFSAPWAVKTIENIHWLWIFVFYLFLAPFVYWLKKRERLKFLNY